jgi:DNA-binding NtrC family response regulator
MKKILFVDDNFVFHMLHVEELEEKGKSVSKRGELEDLINIIDENAPDEVVMDIRAANHRGLDIMKDASKARHNLPFELCTSSCRDLLKFILSCEKRESCSDREQKASHSFAA